MMFFNVFYAAVIYNPFSFIMQVDECASRRICANISMKVGTIRLRNPQPYYEHSDTAIYNFIVQLSELVNSLANS